MVDLIARKSGNPWVTIHSGSDPGKIAWRAISFVLWHEYFMRDNRELSGEIEKMAGGEDGGKKGFEPGFLRSCEV